MIRRLEGMVKRWGIVWYVEGMCANRKVSVVRHVCQWEGSVMCQWGGECDMSVGR